MRLVSGESGGPYPLCLDSCLPPRPLCGKPSFAQEVAWAIYEGVLIDMGPVSEEAVPPPEASTTPERSPPEDRQLRLL